MLKILMSCKIHKFFHVNEQKVHTPHLAEVVEKHQELFDDDDLGMGLI